MGSNFLEAVAVRGKYRKPAVAEREAFAAVGAGAGCVAAVAAAAVVVVAAAAAVAAHLKVKNGCPLDMGKPERPWTRDGED